MVFGRSILPLLGLTDGIRFLLWKSAVFSCHPCCSVFRPGLSYLMMKCAQYCVLPLSQGELLRRANLFKSQRASRTLPLGLSVRFRYTQRYTSLHAHQNAIQWANYSLWNPWASIEGFGLNSRQARTVNQATGGKQNDCDPINKNNSETNYGWCCVPNLPEKWLGEKKKIRTL